MAPKRRPRRVVKTVVTATKTVEETVKMVVTTGGEVESENVEVVSSSTKEKKDVEVLTVDKEPIVKTIPVEEKSPEQDEDETQPASEPENAPHTAAKGSAASETSRKPAKENGGQRGNPEEKSPRTSERWEQKAQKAERTPAKRRRKRGAPAGVGGEGYKTYVYRVMKQVHPEMGISSKAMTIINNLMSDMFERLAEEAARLQKYTGRRTMSSREIQGAVKLVLPGDLGKHAIAEGTKAVSNYVSHVSNT
ncbi:Histone H2B.2 [Sesamum angolense]|uniref:Histone H2B.2 n=1 Tax=Sesamum angolense TaxID=2727404 RepID=A0AAE1XAP3_9LAMI|nr:Histone H2B.2 [Sesamum angolense]